MKNDQVNQVLELLRVQNILFLIFGILLIIGCVRVVNKLGEKLAEKFGKNRLAILQVSTIISFSLYVLGIPFIIYLAFRPPRELIFAIAGSLAVAIGFAIKDVVSSFVSGIVFLFDKPAQVGDRVMIGDTYGEITSIGLRAVRLTTLDDNVVTIPNTKFITEQVSSGNFGALNMMIVVNFHIALDEDINTVTDILNEIVVTSRFAYLAKPINVVVQEVEIAMKLAYRFSVKAYVLDVRYEKAFQTDIVKRANKVFLERGIKRP
ncbi:mechanosensitive ion channel [Halobacteriovorax sp. GB3]|uniref:mechanosensitive ion channel family protein n=1 Tax=Halobacteriovorax sp. GB3 TaxID=2719615 RepID=UPI00235F54D9|nr:mechanosensitive ion channel domain-containing protein [Halobacteriovorax sp. GB3]MDD0852498.1 mechanosensitive ion channel [Halobacteriovorax sp. GB3]